MDSGERFQIEVATWHDLSQLRVIEQECFNLDAWPLFDLIGVLTMPGIVRLKAIVGDQMAGFIAGDRRPTGDMAWITTLGVRPAYRRHGIAIALLEECEQRLNTARIRLTVRRSNHAAIQLYLRVGYSHLEVWKAYYSGGEDGIVLEKRR